MWLINLIFRRTRYTVVDPQVNPIEQTQLHSEWRGGQALWWLFGAVFVAMLAFSIWWAVFRARVAQAAAPPPTVEEHVAIYPSASPSPTSAIPARDTTTLPQPTSTIHFELVDQMAGVRISATASACCTVTPWPSAMPPATATPQVIIRYQDVVVNRNVPVTVVVRVTVVVTAPPPAPVIWTSTPRPSYTPPPSATPWVIIWTQTPGPTPTTWYIYIVATATSSSTPTE